MKSHRFAPEWSARILGFLIFWSLAASHLQAGLPAFSFFDFESESGWHQEELSTEKRAGLVLIQGRARIVAKPESDSQQVLELGPSAPFPALFVDASTLSKSPVVFCDFICKPCAVEPESGEEFLDFGGAVVGFFRVGKRGELRALFGRPGNASVWISTGVQFDLDAHGIAENWLRITVRLDRKTERWDIKVNGQAALNGLQADPGEAGGLPLWLFGSETQSTWIDDLLLTAVEPDQLEKMIAWRNARQTALSTSPPAASAPKLVSHAAPRGAFHAEQPLILKAAEALVKPVLNHWQSTLQAGDQVFQQGASFEQNGIRQSIIAHGIPSDEEGHALPGNLTMTADVQLQPGVDLSQIHWIIGETKDFLAGTLGEILMAGDFSSGLVQTAQLPPDWMRKLVHVQVWVPPNGPDTLWVQFQKLPK